MGHAPQTPAAAERLAAAGCVAADAEAAALVAATAGDADALEAALRRRESGEPLAWITGVAWFCGRAVRVDPGVYVPRPQSEALARRAAVCLAGRVRPRVADLCTGSGAVAVHVSATVPGAHVVGVDADARAAACARRNGVLAVVGDVGRPLAPRRFDLVTAVAPYVPTGAIAYLPSDVRRFEPRAALDGGGDGLDVVRRVVESAADLLRADGWLLLEVGGDQDHELAPTLAAHGFSLDDTWRDADGDLRGLAARRAAS